MSPNIGAAVYGLITVGALLAAEGTSRESYGDTVAAVAVALAVYWLAHGYAEFTARRLRDGERLTVAGFARTMVQELAILAGATLPLLAVLIAWAAGAGLGTAIEAAVWTAAGSIVVIEVISGLRAELGGRELLIQAAIGASLGLLVIVLRLLLH
jgi:hypothetical protein